MRIFQLVRGKAMVNKIAVLVRLRKAAAIYLGALVSLR